MQHIRNVVSEAVARGWCSPENSHKETDSTLAAAIMESVVKALVAAGVPTNLPTNLKTGSGASL